ncbi:hypothetical protein [uncultured Sphingomonas sp.]|uniref:hypothetical protein n=1 Tax=uncultured Sphingomonas sp. TaxID=158754 RepID=UPI0035CC0F08
MLARGNGVALGEWPRTYEAQVRDGYCLNAVAQRAVRLVAEGVASAPIEASAPELAALVGARIGGRPFLEGVAAQMLLHGNAFVAVMRGAEGGVEGLSDGDVGVDDGRRAGGRAGRRGAGRDPGRGGRPAAARPQAARGSAAGRAGGADVLLRDADTAVVRDHAGGGDGVLGDRPGRAARAHGRGQGPAGDDRPWL